jgi:hypothetical protein
MEYAMAENLKRVEFAGEVEKANLPPPSPEIKRGFCDILYFSTKNTCIF